MASLFHIGISGLLASQRALATVGHNIANVNTEGFSRQRVELVARPPQGFGSVFEGRGVDIAAVRRVVDSFVDQQVRTSVTDEARARVQHELSAQLSDMLGDPTVGLAPALAAFFNGVQDLAADPASTPARQALLGEARTLVARLRDQAGRMSDIAAELNARLEVAVAEVNALARAIADLNRDIVSALGTAQGGPPNDLLDQRDLLLNRLAERTRISVVAQDDGAVNVMIGKGQVLVAGGTAQRLAVVVHPLDASRRDIAVDVNGMQSVITGTLEGGEIGAVLAFRDELLEPARNALGRIAVTLAASFNAQHRAGMDLDGNAGSDFFTVAAPEVLASPANAGAIDVDLDGNAIGDLTTATYELTYDGADFTLRRLADGATQTLAGAGPFTVDGMVITVTAPPAAGDRYLIAPVRQGARDIALAVGGVRAIAAAAPVRARADLANAGQAAVSPPEIVNPSDPALLTPVSLVFDDPPATFRIDGVGPPLPYTSGADIDVNGWRVRIEGAPAAGDRFIVEPNAGGVGDNRNALALAGLQAKPILDGATATYQEAHGALIAEVGTATQQGAIARDAFAALAEQARAARAEISGVNLDEEAANLLRFQQAYQAAAETIRAAQTAFDALLRALGG